MGLWYCFQGDCESKGDSLYKTVPGLSQVPSPPPHLPHSGPCPPLGSTSEACSNGWRSGWCESGESLPWHQQVPLQAPASTSWASGFLSGLPLASLNEWIYNTEYTQRHISSVTFLFICCKETCGPMPPVECQVSSCDLPSKCPVSFLLPN